MMPTLQYWGPTFSACIGMGAGAWAIGSRHLALKVLGVLILIAAVLLAAWVVVTDPL